jgi:uncharacterized membrane protein (UPF0127 family)
VRRFRNARTTSLECPSGEIVDLWRAERWALRLRGLTLLDALPRARGLLIPRCNSVQTFCMRFAIDVVFVRAEPLAGAVGVVAVRRAVKPLRIAAVRSRGHVDAIELAAGSASALAIEPGCYLSSSSCARRSTPKALSSTSR